MDRRFGGSETRRRRLLGHPRRPVFDETGVERVASHDLQGPSGWSRPPSSWSGRGSGTTRRVPLWERRRGDRYSLSRPNHPRRSPTEPTAEVTCGGTTWNAHRVRPRAPSSRLDGMRRTRESYSVETGRPSKRAVDRAKRRLLGRHSIRVRIHTPKRTIAISYRIITYPIYIVGHLGPNSK